MPELQDPLLIKLHNDLVKHDMKSASSDATAIIRRDTDLSNPANTTKSLTRDYRELVSSGVAADTLQKLGLLPDLKFETPPGKSGAVMTDGKTQMPVSAKDVTRNFGDGKESEHGKVLDTTESVVNGQKVTTKHYADGWVNEHTKSADGVEHFNEHSPDSKEFTNVVTYPDGFAMMQRQTNGHQDVFIQYPPNADGKVYVEYSRDDGDTMHFVHGWAGIKQPVPVVFRGSMHDVENKYKDRVDSELTVKVDPRA